MTRYFYTDPLEAAWMAKQFGMKFERGDGDWILDWDDVVDDLAMRIASDLWIGKYAILPESLSLLKPQHGDIGQNDLGECFRFDAGRGTVNGCWMTFGGSLCFEFKKEPRIIQRIGVAFMWPEVE